MTFALRFHIPRPDLLLRTLTRRRRVVRLETSALEGALAHYGLDLLRPPEGAPEGNRSKTAVIHTSAGKKVLRNYAPTLGDNTIRMEHSVLRHLRVCDFPAPHIVPSKEGDTLVRTGADRYVLFDFIEGGYHYHHYVLTPGQCLECIEISAELLGNLHRCLDDFVPEGYNPDGFTSLTGDRERSLDWLLSKLPGTVERTRERRLDARCDTVEKLLRQAADFERAITGAHAAITAADPRRHTIHADYGPYNLLFRDGVSPVVLDFEMVRLDWRAVDLVRALYRFCHDRGGFRDYKLRCFLEAYRRRVDLDAEELALIPEIWRYLSLRQVLQSWERYTADAAETALKTIRLHLRQLEWLHAEESRLRELFGGTKTVVSC